MGKMKIVVVGAGGRGDAYSNQIAGKHSDKAEIVAVCEPRPEWRAKFAKKFNVPEESCFKDWKYLLERRHRSAEHVDSGQMPEGVILRWASPFHKSEPTRRRRRQVRRLPGGNRVQMPLFRP